MGTTLGPWNSQVDKLWGFIVTTRDNHGDNISNPKWGFKQTEYGFYMMLPTNMWNWGGYNLHFWDKMGINNHETYGFAQLHGLSRENRGEWCTEAGPSITNHSPAIPGIASTPLKFRYLNPTIHPFARPAWVRHLHVPNQVDPALRLQNVAELL